jgi:hypothetical protein
MAQVTNLWTIVLGVAGLLAMFAVVGYFIARFRRSRESSSGTDSSQAPVSDADAAFLDSSHIGLEPFAGGESLPRYDANNPVRKGYSKRRPR